MKEYDYEKRIMGSDASISIVASDQRVADSFASKLFLLAEEEEAQFSRFKETSELSRLNLERSLVVSPNFMETFLFSLELYRKSKGIFNPLVDISRFGYDADISLVKGTHREKRNYSSLYNIDMETVIIDKKRMTIQLQEGQKLDFGGFLKGHVAEKMVRAASGCAGVVVNLGGDIFSNGSDVEGRPFVFSVDNPLSGEARMSFVVSGKGIATSGSYNRHWNFEGAPFHHILDRSGTQNPVSDLLSVTVIAPTGREADALATVALILGSTEGARVLKEKHLEYCFIRNDGVVDTSEHFPVVSTLSPYSYVN